MDVTSVQEGYCRSTFERLESGATWATYGIACVNCIHNGARSGRHETCIGKASALSEGFQTCVMQKPESYANEGEAECPAAYPENHVLYRGVDGCGECDGDLASTRTCSYELLRYGADDATCGEPMMSHVLSQPGCIDLPPGEGLGSVVVKVADPGAQACVNDGQRPHGELKPREPRFFCCQPRAA